MGNATATEMAKAVDDRLVSLRIALIWHLTSNHYPPYPEALVDVAIQAIEKANEYDFESRIDLPQDILFRAQTSINVMDALESMHLHSFVSQE